MIRKRGEPMIGREYLFLLVCFMPFFRPTVHCLVPLWAIPFLRLPGLTLQMSTNLLASTKATIVRSELLCLLYPSLPKARLLWLPAAYISVDCQHKCQSFNYWSSVNASFYIISYIYIYVYIIVRIWEFIFYTSVNYHNTGLRIHIHPHHLCKYTTAPGPGWTATSPATCEYCSKEDDCTTGMERPDVASHQGFDGMIVTSRIASKSSCFQFF